MKQLKLLLSLLMLCWASSALAHDFEVNGIYYKKNGTEATVTYRGTSSSQYPDEYTGSVTIPSTVTYNGTTYPVTAIDMGAFSYCTNLTNMTIGPSVKVIGIAAFKDCTGMTSLIISNSVTTINLSAFSGCSGLTSVTFPNSVTTIGSMVFAECTGLTSLTIPNSVSSIDPLAFYGCSSIASIKVNSGNSTYDSRNNCNAIIETASNTLAIGCKNTTIPNTVTTIGNSAFYGCTNLTSVTIPNSVTTISKFAFYQCSGLKSFTIPNTVTTIGNRAFYDCTGLTSVICQATTPPTMENSSVFSNYSKPTLYVPAESLQAYQTTDYWNMFTNILSTDELDEDRFVVNGIYYQIIDSEVIVTFRGKSWSQYSNEYSGSVTIPSTVTHNGTTYPVTAIGDHAFRNCTTLTNVTIPNSVTSIGTYAFSDCSSLTSMLIPNSVTTIGPVAFDRCSSLTSVTIGNSVTAISNYMFYGCSGLTSVTIPNSVTSIGNYAFQNCIGLTSISIPNSVTSIGTYAFSDCSGLTSVTIGDSVTTIGNYVFFGCSGLTSMTIPKSVTSIGYGLFAHCSGLTSITVENGNSIYDSRDNCNAIIETASNTLIAGCKNTTILNSVTAIGYAAFHGCTGLTSVTIPNSVTSIGEWAFLSCKSMTSVTIPNSVIAIRDGVFYLCEGLKSVTIPNSVTSIGNNAFESCISLTSMTIPNSVTTIGINAFYRCDSLKSVTIGSSITSIGSSAFNGCNRLESLICKADTPPTMGNRYVFDNNTYSSVMLYVPEESLEAYQTTDYWNLFTNILSMEHLQDDKFEVNGIYYYIIGDEAIVTYKGTSYSQYNNEYSGSVTIPSTITHNGLSYPVTTIGENAFSGCSALMSLALPNSLKTIKKVAFEECTGLIGELVIPNSVTHLGEAAFIGCSGLTSVTILGPITRINDELFFDCSSLASVSLPNTVTYIGDAAFEGCTSLTSFTIPNAVDSIIYSAFKNCTGLTEIVIPNSVTHIGKHVFSGCTGLTSVTIGNSVAEILEDAFGGCTSLTSIVVADDNAVFDSRDNCNGIIETATNKLICGCKTTVIPNTVTTIGDAAFEEMSTMTSVTIPASVTYIEEYAFDYCIGLTSVICKATTPPVMGGIYVFDHYNNYNTYTKATLYVPAASLQAYRNTDYWNRFTNILPIDSLQNEKFEVNGIYYYIIGDEAIVTYKGTSWYQYNEYSGSVTIPSTVIHNGMTYPVTTIGEAAFSDCSGLTNVTFSNSVTSISKHAFSGCNGLTSLTLPNSVTTIEEEAFDSCSGLTGDLVIPNSVTFLGEAVFVDCSNLTSVTIPTSITRISDELFWNCTGLTNVNLPNTITCIGEVAFEGCTSLTSLTIPNSVDSIMYCAFKNCTGLKSIDIPNSVTFIEDEAFWDCSGLESLTISSSVVTITPEAFGGCSGLTSIVVAEDNPVYDSRDNCNGIIETATNKLICGCKTTVIPDIVTTIGEAAFEGISSMTSVTIPSLVNLIETDAFIDCTGLISIISKPTTPPTIADHFVFNDYTTPTLYVPAASLQAYQNAEYWNRFYRILPIEDYASDMPTITTELSIGALTVTASGNGTVVLMVDGVVVENPYDIPRTEQTQVVTVTATAQEEGKLISDIASLEVTIPAILPLNNDNYLSLSDTATVRGATLRIPVRMTNAATIVSFQTDIELDEGLEVVQVDGDFLIEPSDRMTRTHSISSNRLANGNIRVLCYSTNYKAFTGNSGDELFYITVRGTAAAEGDYTITLKNTLFTDRDFDELRAPDASATVNVQPYLLGDANGSGTVTVTDVVVTAQRVLEYDPQPFVFEGADVNEDGIISVTDVTRIAYMVLNSLTMHAPMRAPVMWNNGDCLSAADISIAADETRTVAIRLDNALDYTALQFDLTLPDGLTAANFRLTERSTGLSLDVNDVGNGTTRVLCYSPALAAISGHEGVLMTFDVTANGAVRGDITVDGTELVTTGCQTVMLDGFTIGVNGTTGVNKVAAGKTVARVDYFNLAGQQIDRPDSGVSIVVTTYTDGTSSTTKIIK